MITRHCEDLPGAEVIMDCDGWAVDPMKGRKGYERLLNRALRLWPHPSEVMLTVHKEEVFVTIAQRWYDMEPGEWIHLGQLIHHHDLYLGVTSDGDAAYVTFSVSHSRCYNIPRMREYFKDIRRRYTRRSCKQGIFTIQVPQQATEVTA